MEKKKEEVKPKVTLKERFKEVKRISSKVVGKTIKGATSGKALKKPKSRIKSIQAERIIAGTGYTPLVKPGEEGYFRSEYNKEAKWLS